MVKKALHLDVFSFVVVVVVLNGVAAARKGVELRLLLVAVVVMPETMNWISLLFYSLL